MHESQRLVFSEALLDQVSVYVKRGLMASRMSNPTAMSFHHLKKFHKQGKFMQRKLFVLGETFRFRLEWKQKPQKVNIRRIPCIE